MVTYQFIYSGAHEDGILFLQQNLEMALRSEDREDGWNDTRPNSELTLSDFVEAESSNGVGDGLDDFDGRF